MQAEAPPGPLFSSFKQLIAEGGATSTDVAFYFGHWLTDLAGAVPTPLAGSEKFALQFPHAVLAGFVRSFPLVQVRAMMATRVPPPPPRPLATRTLTRSSRGRPRSASRTRARRS